MEVEFLKNLIHFYLMSINSLLVLRKAIFLD